MSVVKKEWQEPAVASLDFAFPARHNALLEGLWLFCPFFPRALDLYEHCSCLEQCCRWFAEGVTMLTGSEIRVP
jgi:hypothetical protein